MNNILSLTTNDKYLEKLKQIDITMKLNRNNFIMVYPKALHIEDSTPETFEGLLFSEVQQECFDLWKESVRIHDIVFKGTKQEFTINEISQRKAA